MAIDYELFLCGAPDLGQARALLSALPTLGGLTPHVRQTDDEDRASLQRQHGISPDLVVRLSVDKRIDPTTRLNALATALDALLDASTGQALLLENGEDVLLRRDDGALTVCDPVLRQLRSWSAAPRLPPGADSD